MKNVFLIGMTFTTGLLVGAIGIATIYMALPEVREVWDAASDTLIENNLTF